MKTASRPWPRELVVRAGGQALSIAWDDGAIGEIPAELLRVESPSAEVQGHGPSSRKLVTGKHNVAIVEAHPVGRYAVRMVFSDGHATGIYTWDLLKRFCDEGPALMADYRARVAAAAD
jgi:DUF971 family protein